MRVSNFSREVEDRVEKYYKNWFSLHSYPLSIHTYIAFSWELLFRKYIEFLDPGQMAVLDLDILSAHSIDTLL